MQPSMNKRGITLIELLVVILIVGILASIGMVSYRSYLVRARRSDAKTALEQIRASQEMRRAERGAYSSSVTELRNTWGGPAPAAGDYNITLVGTSSTFTGTATPSTARQLPDGNLTINQDGTKLPADKWAK